MRDEHKKDDIIRIDLPARQIIIYLRLPTQIHIRQVGQGLQ